MISFRAHGIPRPWSRPRFDRRSGRVFDSGSSDAWRADVLRCGRSARPRRPLVGPLIVLIDFLLPRPRRLCRRSDPTGEIPCDRRPDRDNLEKAVLDALQADGWFVDDAQVVGGEVRKLYHAIGEAPGARITIAEVTL